MNSSLKDKKVAKYPEQLHPWLMALQPQGSLEDVEGNDFETQLKI